MARFLITSPPFTYVGVGGGVRYVARDPGPYATNILDTAAASWAIPAGWIPPIIGLSPLDQAAADALVAARAPYISRGQMPGIGVVPVNEPIVVF